MSLSQSRAFGKAKSFPSRSIFSYQLDLITYVFLCGARLHRAPHKKSKFGGRLGTLWVSPPALTINQVISRIWYQ
jgi:hypothetical protein